MLERAVWGPPVSMRARRQDLSHVAVLSALSGSKIYFYDQDGSRSALSFSPAEMPYDDLVPALQEAGLRVDVDNSWLRRMLRA